MNMPLNDEGETIHFTTTLFALVRTSLQIRMTGNMNANDTKLRKMITEDWPNITPRVLDQMIPKNSGKTKLYYRKFPGADLGGGGGWIG